MNKINQKAFVTARDIALDWKAQAQLVNSAGDDIMLQTFLESYLAACAQDDSQHPPLNVEAEAVELVADGICERWEYGSREYALSLARRGLMKMMKKFKLVAR